MAFSLIVLSAGCGQQASKPATETTAETAAVTTAVVTNLAKPDMARWQYNAEYDLYYQIGIDYCEKPADTGYEQLSVFVPAAYLRAKANGDGTYTCELNEKGAINGYTAADAPIVMPVFTEGYSAAEALTEERLNGDKSFTEMLCSPCRGILMKIFPCHFRKPVKNFQRRLKIREPLRKIYGSILI